MLEEWKAIGLPYTLASRIIGKKMLAMNKLMVLSLSLIYDICLLVDYTFSCQHCEFPSYIYGF